MKFPIILYRKGPNGERESKSFTSAETVEPGFVTYHEFMGEPAPEERAASGSIAPDAARALQVENATLRAGLEKAEADLEEYRATKGGKLANELRAEIEGLREQIAQLNTPHEPPGA